MKRREFITLLGGAAAWPLAARAQKAGKVPTIGFLGAATPATASAWTAAFTQRLGELGWVEGSNVAIEYRWAEGRSERFAEIASEFVRLKVDIIVTHSSPPVLAAKQATSVIPIVFATAGNPVGTGLVASLARPGGNVTGLSNQTGDLAAKRVELLRQVAPRLTGLAILANVENPAAVADMHEAETAARTLGLDAIPIEIRRAEDIAPGFEARLPTMHGFREYVQSAGLMSYGPNLPDGFRRAADYVDKILSGAKPGDLPVEQPTKFDLVINAKTARALGLEIPHTLLALADEVIE